jgi:flagellin-specific chaperone FliS
MPRVFEKPGFNNVKLFILENHLSLRKTNIMRIDSKAVSSYYRKMRIITLPQYNRIAFLHEAMFNTVRLAIYGEKRYIRSRLDSVQNILVQLTSIIKTDSDENELANELLLLYDYLYVKLENEDIASMNDSLQVLSLLHETFHNLIKKRE